MTHVDIIPSSNIATVSNVGQTSVALTYTKSKQSNTLVGIIARFAAQITGTAPGTPHGISQSIRDVQVVSGGNNINWANMKGQTLFTHGLAEFGYMQEVGLQYQTLTDPNYPATGVQAVGQYPIITNMNVNDNITVTVNVNPPTVGGWVTPTVANYQLNISGIETPSPVKDFNSLLGEYFTSAVATYVPSVKTRDVVIAADNVEQSVDVLTATVGGNAFAATGVQAAEDAFNGLIPSGITLGSATAGLATKPALNSQTANGLYCARYFGPTPSLASITWNTAPAIWHVVSKVPKS